MYLGGPYQVPGWALVLEGGCRVLARRSIQFLFIRRRAADLFAL